jgi:hypothetical protein
VPLALSETESVLLSVLPYPTSTQSTRGSISAQVFS